MTPAFCAWEWCSAILEVAYRARLELSRLLAFPLISPDSATVKLNTRCNSQCRYCYVWRRRDAKEGLPASTYSALFSEMSRLGISRINLTGGEPLLHPGVEAIVEQADRCGLQAGLITNGLLLSPERLNRLVEAGMESISVSLDTLDPEVYARLRGIPIDAVLSNIIAASSVARSRSDVHLNIICVVTSQNIGSLPLLAGFAQQHGIRLLLQPVQVVSSSPGRVSGYHLESLLLDENRLTWARLQIERLIDSYGDTPWLGNPSSYLRRIPDFLCRQEMRQPRRCYVGLTNLNVEADLTVRPCWRMEAVADLKTQHLQDVWHSPAFRQARVRMRTVDCPSCWLLYRRKPVRCRR